MAGLYFEEFHEGQVFEHELRKTLTESDNMLFSTMTLNPQPLHIDRHFSQQTDWGQPLMNSVLTLGLVIGVSVGDTTLGTTIDNLGMKDTQFPHPVFQGDTIRATTEVVGVRASRSKPDRGIIDFLHKGYNQDDVLVCQCHRQAMMRRRPQGAD
ncbi:MAG: MaoC family dehydratase [Rhizobiaceae bacterium]|nr:MaoC family dehydratase [Rhizobiaceae bacterium]